MHSSHLSLIGIRDLPGWKSSTFPSDIRKNKISSPPLSPLEEVASAKVTCLFKFFVTNAVVTFVGPQQDYPSASQDKLAQLCRKRSRRNAVHPVNRQPGTASVQSERVIVA